MGQQLGVSGTDATTARTLPLAILQQRVRHAFFHHAQRTAINVSSIPIFSICYDRAGCPAVVSGLPLSAYPTVGLGSHSLGSHSFICTKTARRRGIPTYQDGKKDLKYFRLVASAGPRSHPAVWGAAAVSSPERNDWLRQAGRLTAQRFARRDPRQRVALKRREQRAGGLKSIFTCHCPHRPSGRRSCALCLRCAVLFIVHPPPNTRQ